MFSFIIDRYLVFNKKLSNEFFSTVDLIMKDSKMKDEGSYMLTTQDLYVMKTIRVGCDELRDKLALHNIFVAIN